jgi:hypothetical protein
MDSAKGQDRQLVSGVLHRRATIIFPRLLQTRLWLQANQ